MKKTILLVIAVLTVGMLDLHAQGAAVGLKAGLNFANQDIEGADTDSRTGYHFGAYGRVNVALGFGVQAEAYYSVQGSDVDLGAATAEVKTNYLQVPILLRKNFVKVLNVHVGPQFGVLLKNEFDGVDVKDQAKSSDLSFAAGVGLNLPMGLNATLRYVKGLSNVSDVSGQDVKNNMFQVSIGYDLFDIGND